MLIEVIDHIERRDRDRARKLQIRARILDALRDGIERTPDQLAAITGLGRMCICVNAPNWPSYFRVHRHRNIIEGIIIHRDLRHQL